jgi:hypothetical protein
MVKYYPQVDVVIGATPIIETIALRCWSVMRCLLPRKQSMTTMTTSVLKNRYKSRYVGLVVLQHQGIEHRAKFYLGQYKFQGKKSILVAL